MEYTFTKYPVNINQLSDKILSTMGLFTTKIYPNDILDGNITYANDNKNDNLIIDFNIELTSDKENTLNNIVSNHIANSEYNKLDWARRRDVILPLFYLEAGSQLQNFSGLPINRKIMSCNFFLIPYSIRVQIISNEQDAKNWVFLLEETKQSRADCVEAMRKHVGQYIRIGGLTLFQTQQFYKDTMVYIQWFSESNLPDLKQWISNEPSSLYETNGFAQASYYDSTLRDELMAIYNGNY